MAKSVADQFVETLAAAGVTRIYGILGDSLSGLTDAVRRQDKIEWLHVRHDQCVRRLRCADLDAAGRSMACYSRGTRRVAARFRLLRHVWHLALFMFFGNIIVLSSMVLLIAR